MNAPKQKRAIIYCRVSTKEQVDEGNSLITQEKECKEYARKNGYEVASVFVEQGESAKTADRTQLQILLRYIADKKNKVNALIIYKLDRLSRNTDDYSQLRILFKKYGVEIKSVSEPFENTPTGRFMENMMANVAQFDNDVRAERCKGGMIEAVKEGRYVWMAPVGYENTRIAGKANITPSQMAPLVRKAFELVAKHLSPTDEIRQLLTKEGLALPNGKPVSKGYFYKMLRNKMYAGYILKFGECSKGNFEPLVSLETFEQVQRVLKSKGWIVSDYKTDNPDFPLRRFAVNMNNEKLTGSWSKGNGGRYAFYRFGNFRPYYQKAPFEKDFMDFMDTFALDSQNMEKLKRAIRKNWTKRQEGGKQDSQRLRDQIKELTDRQGLLVSKNLSGVINDVIAKQQLDLLDNEILDAQVSLSAFEEKEVDVEEALAFSEAFLRTPSKIWVKSEFPTQLKLQWFQFPQGIVFDGEKFGTKEISFVFKEKDTFSVSLSTGVDPSGLEPLASGVQNRCSTR